MKRTILDTGPIVALFDKSDKFNSAIYDFIKDYKGVFISTWPVISEVSFLLEYKKQTQIDFFKWLELGGINLIDIDCTDILLIREMMEKYSNVPMDLADASLMLISDKLELESIITLDKDFYIYRKYNGSCITNLLSDIIS